MDSLDPRINRHQLERSTLKLEKRQMDQLETYEVFVQTKPGKTYEHEGIVHAGDTEMAFLFAKEQFSRRYTCSGIWTVSSENVTVTHFTDDQESVYESVDGAITSGTAEYDIFHLLRRGKQHKHAGTVTANSAEEALQVAKTELNPEKPVYNIWVIESKNIYKSSNEDRVIWSTLHEKQFREALDYKGASKIKDYKERKK